MEKVSYNEENQFGRFFFSPTYLTLKNFLFNYRLRKFFVHQASKKFFKDVMVAKNSIIVDIGSGISPITPVPRKTKFIDLEKEAIDYLRAKRMNCELGNITNLNLKENSTDLIFCSEVLEHIPDYKKAIAELYRVLKKDGGVIITVPVHENYWKNDDDFVGHLRRFNPSALVRDIRATGFKVLEKKAIGNWLERNLTWLMIRLARKRIKKMSKQREVSKTRVAFFYLINSMLFYLIRSSYAFNTINKTSIILIVAKK